MNEQSQIHGFRLGAILGPMVAVGMFQFAMNEPSNARAGSMNAEFLTLPTVPEGAINPTLARQDFSKPISPFWFEEVEMSLPVMPVLSRPIQPVDTPDPTFILSAVLPSASKSYAVVNGKARSEGDEIEPGWTLIKISGQERYIILKHISGRRLRVMMSRN